MLEVKRVATVIKTIGITGISGFDQLHCKFPSEKIVINLAPSEVKKSGTSFDLAMLVALLIESGELEIAQSTSLNKTVFLGELGLTGELFHFSGALPMVAYAAKKGYARVILPKDSLNEASMVTGIELTAFEHVEEVVLWLQGKLKITAPQPKPEKKACEDMHSLDFSDVIGHENMMKNYRTRYKTAITSRVTATSVENIGFELLNCRKCTWYESYAERQDTSKSNIHDVCW